MSFFTLGQNGKEAQRWRWPVTIEKCDSVEPSALLEEKKYSFFSKLDCQLFQVKMLHLLCLLSHLSIYPEKVKHIAIHPVRQEALAEQTSQLMYLVLWVVWKKDTRNKNSTVYNWYIHSGVFLLRTKNGHIETHIHLHKAGSAKDQVAKYTLHQFNSSFWCVSRRVKGSKRKSKAIARAMSIWIDWHFAVFNACKGGGSDGNSLEQSWRE